MKPELTALERKLLAVLRKHPRGKRTRHVAEEVDCSPSTASRHLRHLEAMGLVESDMCKSSSGGHGWPALFWTRIDD